MTFPAILHDTQSPIDGALALGIGIAAAWRGAELVQCGLLLLRCGFRGRAYLRALKK